MTKEYLMSEEELIQCIKDWTIQDYVPAYFIKNNFLKSKKPVEVIAEGKIAHNYYGFEIGNKNVVDQVYKWIKKCEGKKGKLIFIEEEE